MAMRLRNWGDGWVAVCAAEHGARPGDIYLDDAHDHAIRVKLMADWKSEGFMFDGEMEKRCLAAIDAGKSRPISEVIDDLRVKVADLHARMLDMEDKP